VSVESIIKDRGITEVLHFTTNCGMTGILASGAVKPRASLGIDRRLEFIVTFNCPDRQRDRDWHGYVNLSITRVNCDLFAISRKKWHSASPGWWCILSFGSEVLTHKGVVFCTTNNAYAGVVVRQAGAEGLERLFAQKVLAYESGTMATRQKGTPANVPTCKQAEVLYPGELGS